MVYVDTCSRSTTNNFSVCNSKFRHGLSDYAFKLKNKNMIKTVLTFGCISLYSTIQYLSPF